MITVYLLTVMITVYLLTVMITVQIMNFIHVSAANDYLLFD
jgi:hypothetical protein